MTRSAAIFMMLMVAVCVRVDAHEASPLYIQLIQSADQQVVLKWKTPRSAGDRALPQPFLSGCNLASAPVMVATADAYVGSYRAECDTGLQGQVLETGFRGENPSLSTLVAVRYADNHEITRVLGPGETAWQLPGQLTTFATAASYLALGIHHILLGWDHLLFIACLFLIAGTWLRLVIIISGFTLAHSVTLALSALKLIALPLAAVEACIVLSILFLAAELARKQRSSLVWRHPLSVAIIFGLVHGLGFASVLNATGLPQGNVITALLFFNIGVELGQLGFLLLLGVMLYLLKRGLRVLDRSYNEALIFRLSAYLAGTCAGFWLMQGTLVFI